LIIKEERYKLSILILKKEVLPLIHLSLTILEVKSLNGTFGIHIFKLSKNNKNKIKKKKTIKIKKNKKIVLLKTNQKEDIQLRSKGV
jgi:hypothetical protein